MRNNRTETPHWFWLMLLGALVLAVAACTDGDDTTAQVAAAGDVVPIDGGSGEASETATSTNDDTVADDQPDNSTDGESDSSNDDTVAAASGSSGPFTIEEAQQAYREFTECMRNEGIQMPPAVFDAAGKIDIDAQLEYFTSLDTAAAETSIADEQAAEEQCAPEHADELLALITPDASDINRVESELNSELDAQLAELAQCMRETFPDFPDPIALDLDITNDAGTDFNPFPGIDPNDPLYADALVSCGQTVGLSVQP